MRKLLLISTIIATLIITALIKPVRRTTFDNIKIVDIITDQLVKNNQKKFYDFGPYSWNIEGHKRAWTYQNGLMMHALLNNHKQFVDNFYNDNINLDGTLNADRNYLNTYQSGNLDFITPARPMFYLRDSKNYPKYKKSIDFIYNKLKKQPILPNIGNNYLHKVNNKNWQKYPFALDGLYASLVFLMEYADKTNLSRPQDIQTEVFRRMDWIAKNMKDSNGLFNHGHNGQKLNGFVWLRAVGWYAMAQVDIIELMPDNEYKTQMKKQLIPFFDQMLLYRDKKTKMWHNVVNSNVKNNRIETSGSAMMAYSLLKACNNNFVEDIKYCAAGLETFDGIMEHKVKRGIAGYKVTDIYLQSNVKESAEEYCQNRLYVSNDAKGVAPLILASQEVKTFYKKKF